MLFYAFGLVENSTYSIGGTSGGTPRHRELNNFFLSQSRSLNKDQYRQRQQRNEYFFHKQLLVYDMRYINVTLPANAMSIYD